LAERQTDSFYLINFIQSTPVPRNSTHSYLTQSNSTQSYLNQSNSTHSYLTQSSSTHSCLTQSYSTHSYLIQSFLSNPIQFNPFNPIHYIQHVVIQCKTNQLSLLILIATQFYRIQHTGRPYTA